MKKLIIAASFALATTSAALAQDAKQSTNQPRITRIMTDKGWVVLDNMNESFGKPAAEYKAPEGSRRSDIVTDAFTTAGERLKDMTQHVAAKVKAMQKEDQQGSQQKLYKPELQKRVQILSDEQAAQLSLYRLKQGSPLTGKQLSPSQTH